MSAAHNDLHGDVPGHPDSEPAEISHPLLWTVFLLIAASVLAWWFFYWMGSGRVEGRQGEPIPPAAGAHAAVEPDHKKLAAERGPDVLLKGSQIYAKNCASCHGANGDSPSNLNPPPRNFRKEPFQNPLGGGPYALYEVVTNGFENMPAFPALSPEDRYAAVTFIRETFVKTSNPKNYVVNDPPAVLAKIPPPGSASTEAVRVEPDLVVIKAPVQPLMESVSRVAARNADGLASWLAATWNARDRHDVQAQRDIASLIALDAEDPGLVAHIHKAVVDGDKTRFRALLVDTDGSGDLHPAFSLMSAARLTAVYQAAAAGASSVSAPGGR